MKLYFAGAEANKFSNILYEEGVRNMLVSYYYLNPKKDLEELKKKGIDLFLDSGGFTGRKMGKEIDLEEYGRFVKNNKQYFSAIANLDVGEWSNQMKNQRYLEQFGKIIPVYHLDNFLNDDRKILDDLIEEYPYIALGGTAEKIANPITLKNYFNYCFLRTVKKGTKVHGFGTFDIKRIKEYPYYSVDATSWLAGGQFGTMIKWDSQKYKMESAIHYANKKHMMERNFNVKTIDSYEERLRHNIREYLKMEKDITELWKKRGIEWIE